ncbi:MAG: hypothetical protein FWD52_07620 [Candidatus Bathyarchaeota archaeon]|nr:hypothetical protein [Candidatus Termiticorpusculum sp.]
MVFKSKKFTLLLIFTIAISGLFLIEPSAAPVTVPANPKAAPEIISVHIHNTPIWRPPVTTTDSYTGDVTYSNPGYYTCNGSIEITLKNRPFNTYTDKNGKYIGRYYTFFYKDSNAQWREDFPRSLEPYAEYQSDKANTIITFKYGDSGIYYAKENTIIDFRVQAVEGHFMSSYETRDFNDGLGFLYTVPAVYEGAGSKYAEFSIKIPPVNEPGTSKLNIQSSAVTPSTSNPNNTPTLNITEPSTDIPSSNASNPAPQNPLQPHLKIILATASIIIIPIVSVVYLNKQQKTNQKFNDTNDQTL